MTEKILDLFKKLYLGHVEDRYNANIHVIHDCTLDAWHLQLILSNCPQPILLFDHCTFDYIDLMSIYFNPDKVLPFFDNCQFNQCIATICATKNNVPKWLCDNAHYGFTDETLFPGFTIDTDFLQNSDTLMRVDEIMLGCYRYLANKGAFGFDLDPYIIVKDGGLTWQS